MRATRLYNINSCGNWNSANLIALFVFSSCCTNGFLIVMICLGGMVADRKESKKVLLENKMTNGKNCAEGKVSRKFWRSCAIIKIKFGSQNYVEELKPLNCLDFSIGLVMQFLLLGE